MNKFQRVKELVCQDCGAKFLGLWGKYCDTCRKERKRNKKHTQKKICPICHKVRRMYDAQVICRLCSTSAERRSKYERLTIKQAQDRIRARKTGGKLTPIERCPNYDGTNINCVTCVPESYKFKQCGVKK